LIVQWEIVDSVEPFDDPTGLCIDGIIFHCLDDQEVTLTLLSGLDVVLDTQIIHQTPEPVSIALLGLGGLFLRRRK
jgi:hypothetical protein